MRKLGFLCLAILCVVLSPAGADPFHFTVTADQRNFDAVYDQLLAQMQVKIGGQGVFQVLPGDIDPPENLRYRIDARMGATAQWYPGVGNHEAETPDDMTWLRSEYTSGKVCRLPLRNYTNQNGPAGSAETTYAWDYGNAHFIMLNEYWNGGTAAGSDVLSDGDVVPQLYSWLAADLAATKKPVVIVFGHEPAYPQNRHIGDSLDEHVANRDAFWNLLESTASVKAYICGHTHYYSKYQKPGGRIWQIDVGDAGNDTDSNGKTFLDVTVTDTQVKFDVWRDPNIGAFSLSETITMSVSGPAPASVGSPSAAKALADGVLAHLPAVVSAAFPGYFYVEDAARTSGIRVNETGHTVTASALVALTGEMKTSPDGDCYIQTPSVVSSAPATVTPVGMIHKSIGGSDWNLNALTGAGQRGVLDGIGLNNLGMFVRVAGNVSYAAPTFFYIDDGSGANDGSGHPGVKVVAPGLTIPAQGSLVAFNAVSSCYKLGPDYYRMLVACSGFPKKPFAAYNDCVWDSRQYIAQHVTTYGIGSGYIGATSGPLVDYSTGDSTGVTATLTQGGGVTWQPDPVSGGSDCNSGTDAYTIFGTIASMSGVIYYGASAGWWVDLELSGLDPGRSYEFTTSSNRNDATYTNRLTRYTLSGADSLTNTSSAGVTITGGGVSSQFCTGYNTVNGCVARWTGITPGADGKFKIRAEVGPGGDAVKAYSFDVFKLSLLP